MYYVNESFLQSITVNLCVLFSPLKSRRKGIIPIRHAIGLKAPGEKRYKYILWNLFSAANGTRKIRTVHADNRKKYADQKNIHLLFSKQLFDVLSLLEDAQEKLRRFLFQLFNQIIFHYIATGNRVGLPKSWNMMTKSDKIKILVNK